MFLLCIYPFIYYSLVHDGKGDLFCGAFWDGRDLYFVTGWPFGLRHISAGRVPRYTDQVGYVFFVPVVVGRGRLTWIPGI